MGRILLASASPRRRELLTLLGVDYEAVTCDVEELTEGDPAEIVVENAMRKARAGQALGEPGDLVIGADTDVAIDGATLGKASGAAGAERRLRALSGRTHEVLSGVAVVGPEGERAELARTEVTFRALSDLEIAAYVASGEWRDRAGAYAVQGLGSGFVARVDGDLSNVIGLPISLLSTMIEGLHSH